MPALLKLRPPGAPSCTQGHNGAHRRDGPATHLQAGGGPPPGAPDLEDEHGAIRPPKG